MATWQNLDLSDLFPGEIEALTATIASVGGSVGTILSSLGTAVGILSSLVIDFSDPISAATQALVNSINAIITDLKDTAVFTLPVTPDTLEDAGGYSGFQGKIIASFSDFADFQRPQFGDDKFVGGIIVAGGAGDLTDFSGVLTPLEALFGFTKFSRFKNLDKVFTTASRILHEVKPSSNKQSITLTGGAGLSRRGGVIKIDNEEISYGSLDNRSGKFKLRGAAVSEAHEAMAIVQRVRDVQGIRPKAKLIGGVSPSTSPQDITVDDASDFPDEGVISIAGERIAYSSRNGTNFLGVVITIAHETAELVTLIGGHPGASQEPDWIKQQIVNVMPAIASAYKALEDFAQLMAPMETASGLLTELGELLTEKGNQITALSDAVDNQLAFLSSILTGTGISILTIPPTSGGLTGFKTNVINSGAKPEWPDGFFVGGVVLLIGSSSLAAANTDFAVLQGLF